MPTPHENLALRLLDSALRRGWAERIAMREGDRSWTYSHLNEQVGRVATVLRGLGVGHGERVAVLMRDSLDAAAAILGAIYMGAVAVPLSELARPLDVKKYLNHCGATAAIVHASLEPALDEIRAGVPSLQQILCVAGAGSAGVHDFHALMQSAVPAAGAGAVASTAPAMLIYSSLCVQQEIRGVPHAHATPLTSFSSFGQGVIGLVPGDRVFSIVRLSTAYGLGTGLFFPLAAGAETFLLPEQPHSQAIFQVLESFAPTVFFATPSVYGQLARDAQLSGLAPPLAGCRVCVSAAEGMPPKLLPKIREVLGVDITVGFSLSEAFQFVFAGTAGEGPQGSAGRPVPGVEVRLVDEAGAPVGPDVIGTLQIRGSTVLQSYWSASKTAETLREPFDRDGWFMTRDRFMMDEEGNFYHCGRVDDLFKVGGKWVSPVEVERALLAHEAVWDCAVIGADDEDGLIKPLAFVVPNIGHQAGHELEHELREYIKSELAPYKYPRWIEFRDTLPRGPGGKLLRYMLKPRSERRRAETGAEPA